MWRPPAASPMSPYSTRRTPTAGFFFVPMLPKQTRQRRKPSLMHHNRTQGRPCKDGGITFEREEPHNGRLFRAKTRSVGSERGLYPNFGTEKSVYKLYPKKRFEQVDLVEMRRKAKIRL